MDLVGISTVVSNAANGSVQVCAGHHDALAIVERLNGGDGLRVLLHQIGELEDILGSLLGRNLPPFALEGFSRRGDGDVDILLGSFLDGADDFFGRGVDGLNLAALFACYPFVVDKSVVSLALRP